MSAFPNPGFRLSALNRRQLLMTGGAALALGAMPLHRAAAQTPLPSGRDPLTLIVATRGSVENLDPATNIEWAMGLEPVYETLTKLDGIRTDRAVPGLCASYSANADNSVWTFDLRDGVRFHDGTICDADAVKAAIVRTITLPIGIGFVWGIDDPETQIFVEGPLRLRFDLGAPPDFFDVQIAGQYGFRIASSTAAEANSTGPDDGGGAYLQSNPVGTVPYRLEALDPGQQASYVLNEDYWGSVADNQFRRLVVRSVPVESSRLQLLRSAEADVIFPLLPEETRNLMAGDEFVVSDTPTLPQHYIALADYGPLADPRARQALNRAFGTDAFRQQVMLDLHDEAKGFFRRVWSMPIPSRKPSDTTPPGRARFRARRGSPRAPSSGFSSPKGWAGRRPNWPRRGLRRSA